MFRARVVRLAGGLLAFVLAGGPLGAAVAPQDVSPLAAREFRHPQLQVEQGLQRVEELAPAARGPLLDAMAELRVASPGAFVDRRTGRFATLVLVHPLLPGTGEGNRIAWDDLSVLPPLDAHGWKVAGWKAFVGYVRAHGAALRVDASELASPGHVTIHDGGALVQIHAPRVLGGVPVRDSHLTAVVSHGNLILMGAHNWGTIRLDSRPTISAEDAAQVLGRFLGAVAPSSDRRAPSLAIVPMATGPLESLAPLDRGLTYRLVWVLSPRFSGDLGTWEALVDAHSGEMIAFTDTNQYQSVRRVQGGVYPVSNDQAPPDGIEQPGWPFPFADVSTSGGTFFTDTGGNLPVCAAGNVSAALGGRYVRMNDNCGAINHSSGGDLDFGVSAGTDCVTPGFGGAGNTHAARTGFFELNKIIEQARGHLPGNAWLQQTLTANTNVNLSCGALWNGTTVNLFRSGSGCANTGEIAGVFDHEWGHGMDDNDANPTISNPGEAIADVYMALRLKQSCVGRGVRPGFNCGGYGNPCLACTGVRDIDWDKRALHQPTTVTWIDANCGTGGTAPCGGGVHCESAVYSEAVWDLFNRDLPAVAGMSPDTALEVATRTTYLGAGLVGTAFTCTQGSGGCPATAAYLNFLAVDDDNGSLQDGTPHMGAIFAAFDRHGIACPTPGVATAGCPNAPGAAPVVTGVAEDRGARLSWAPVPGAVRYRVYRTEGVFGCDFGKVLLGDTPSTTWGDTGLQNGRQYSYTVAAIGLASTCTGPMSACTHVTPAAGANLAADLSGVGIAIAGGDGDPYVDNCESVTVGLPVTNTGSIAQTNVRVVAAQPLSHPGMAVLGFAPGVSLAPCASSTSPAFTFRAVDLAPDATIRFRVDVTSDELAPAVRSFVVPLAAGTEGDDQFVASQTFDFEAGAEGWTTTEGTFDRTNAAPGGAGGPSTFYFQSSAFLGNQCDEVVSPALSLTATSTLSLQNHFDIEPFSGGNWYDRANVGLLRSGAGRVVVSPSSGRPYNASGGGGACGLDGPGWAAAFPTWAASSWTPAALGLPGIAGEPLRLSVKYGTDGSVSGAGFRFDQVTLTNFNLEVPDTQADQCVPGNLPPVANPDQSTSPTLGPVDIPVLSNDGEPDGQCMRVAAVTAPANGTAIVNSVGCPNTDTVTYVPSLTCGLPCNDTFQYTVSDQNGGTATATVTVNQVPVELQTFKVE
jgi:hypothetical protein